MKILFIGSLKKFSTTKFLNESLITLGYEVINLDQLQYFETGNNLLKKIELVTLIGPDIIKYNNDIILLAKEIKPEIVFIDQAFHVWPKTLLELKLTRAKLVHYTTEYLLYQKHWYRHLFKAVHLYDFHIITNLFNVPLLKQKGAKKIIRTHFSYYSDFHKPPILTEEEKLKYKSDVVFIGKWEPFREDIIYFLRSNDIRVKVWGTCWEKAKSLEDRNNIYPLSEAGYSGVAYLKALKASKLCLGLLSKLNKNTSSGRTFEIPAIGSFLLAERTDDHKTYFQEGKEAEFFSTKEELLEKIKYYLSHEKERTDIALSGRNRCLTSGYTYKDRIKEFMKEIT